MDGFTSMCSAQQANQAFMDAYAIVLNSDAMEWKLRDRGEEECHVEAPRFAWTIYYCALSLRGPKGIQPLSARLAHLYLTGDIAEKICILRTVLRWVNASFKDAPLVVPVDEKWHLWYQRLPETLCAFYLASPLERKDLLAFFCPQLFSSSAYEMLLFSEYGTRLEERNVLAMTWHEGMPVSCHACIIPKREASSVNTYELQSPHVNHNPHVMLIKAFQAMEGWPGDCPYVFNATQGLFMVQDGIIDAWFV